MALVARWLLAAVAVVGGCGAPTEVFLREARLEVTVTAPAPLRGGAWGFLFPPGRGPPHSQAVPEYLTAASDLRLAAGDARLSFPQVRPNTYRLWALLDTNGNFDPRVDVLAGPGAGDWIAEGLELNLQPGEQRTVGLPMTRQLRYEPPAFWVEGLEDGGQLELPDQPGEVVSLKVVADTLSLLSAPQTGFVVSLGDRDGDGIPDDTDGDQIPDLFPLAYLRFLPRPGQVVPTQRDGQPAEVIVPLAFNPGALLTALGGDPSRELLVDRLQLFLLPQARAVLTEPGRGEVLEPLEAIPVGDYELWVTQESGQSWRLPNDLGERHPSQSARFRVVHGTSAR
jgi:hypothetical protein